MTALLRPATHSHTRNGSVSEETPQSPGHEYGAWAGLEKDSSVKMPRYCGDSGVVCTCVCFNNNHKKNHTKEKTFKFGTVCKTMLSLVSSRGLGGT